MNWLLGFRSGSVPGLVPVLPSLQSAYLPVCHLSWTTANSARLDSLGYHVLTRLSHWTRCAMVENFCKAYLLLHGFSQVSHQNKVCENAFTSVVPWSLGGKHVYVAVPLGRRSYGCGVFVFTSAFQCSLNHKIIASLWQVEDIVSNCHFLFPFQDKQWPGLLETGCLDVFGVPQ